MHTHRRARSALGWLESRLGGPHLGGAPLGLPEIALVTALDWMSFRDAYPVGDHPALAAFLAAQAERPSFVATNPRP
jgi:glutathione S-transferase